MALLGWLCWLCWAYLGLAPAVPFSDESGHIERATHLQRLLSRAQTPAQQLFLLLGPRDAYPGMLVAISQATTAVLPGVAGVRAAAALALACHAMVAVILGPRMWGWGGTWAYLGLACAGPVMLSLGTLAFVDGPSAAALGIAILTVLSADGFRRPGMAALAGLAGALALYSKWTVLVFLAPVVGWEIVRAVVATTPSVGRRALLALALGVLVLALGSLVWQGGAAPALVSTLDQPQHPEPYLAVIGGGLALAVLTPLASGALRKLGRNSPPAAVAAVFLVIVVAVAGPWYLCSQADLLGRLQHETAVYAGHGAGSSGPDPRGPLATLRTLLDVAPAATLALLPGVFTVLTWRPTAGRLLASLTAALIGGWLVLTVLPPDLRYLLPLGPLLAAAAALALRDCRAHLALPLGLSVAVLQLGTASALASPSPKPRWDTQGSQIIARLPAPWPPLPLGPLAIPDPLTPDALQTLLSFLGQLTDNPLRVRVLESEQQQLQGRALTLLAAAQGISLKASDGVARAASHRLPSDSLVITTACPDPRGPVPLLVVQTRPGRCDLGLYRGEFPDAPSPPAPAAPGPPGPPG